MGFRKSGLAAVLLASLCPAQVPVGYKANNPPVIPDSVTLESNVKYGQFPETVLDILQPKAASKQKRPGVLVIHGGGWTGGTKEQRTEPVCLRYVEQGFVCANVEYRLAKAATAPAA